MLFLTSPSDIIFQCSPVLLTFVILFTTQHLTFISASPINKFDSACMLSHFSCIQLCAILWTVACQAPLSMGFFRQVY